MLVTTAEPDRLREARKLIDQMESEGLHLGAIVINRFLDEVISRGFTNDHALDDIVGLRAALDADGAVDAAMAETLSCYRDINRVKRFVDGLPARVKVAFAPGNHTASPHWRGLRIF